MNTTITTTTTTVLTSTLTEQEFVDREIALWSEDYIYDLIDRGYEPVYIEQLAKWSWLLPAN